MRCQLIGLVNFADHAGAVFCWAQMKKGIVHATARIKHDFLIYVGLGVLDTSGGYFALNTSKLAHKRTIFSMRRMAFLLIKRFPRSNGVCTVKQEPAPMFNRRDSQRERREPQSVTTEMLHASIEFAFNCSRGFGI